MELLKGLAVKDQRIALGSERLTLHTLDVMIQNLYVHHTEV